MNNNYDSLIEYKRFLYFKDNTKVSFYALDNQLKESIISADSVVKSFNEEDGRNILVLKSGRVIVGFSKDYHELYENMSMYESILLKEKSNDILQGLNPFNEFAILKKDSVINSFFEEFKVGNYRTSVNGLEDFDEVTSSVFVNADYIDKWHLAITFYVGDVYIKEKGGSWSVKLRNDNVWVVTITDNTGRDIGIADRIYTSLIQSMEADLPWSAFMFFTRL